MPSSVTGNLSFVRTTVLNRLGKVAPNVTNFIVLSFFCRGPSLFCLSLHMTYKTVGFQLSLKEGWLRKGESYAFPDHESILKTRKISGLLSVPFSWMHVKGWRAGFLLVSHATSARPLTAQKPGAVGWQMTAGQTDRDLSEWKGRGDNGRLQLTAPLPWATSITAHGSGWVILHSFYSVWKNLAAPRKQTLGMICSYLLFVCVKGWLCRRAHKECLWSE